MHMWGAPRCPAQFPGRLHYSPSHHVILWVVVIQTTGAQSG